MKAILIILVLLVLFVLFPISGISALLEGDTDSGIKFLIPLTSLLLGALFYFVFVQIMTPRIRRHEALHIMHKIPYFVDKEYGEFWDKKFQKVIARAIESTSDDLELSDLQQCQKISNDLKKNSGAFTKDSPFNKINKSFLLTGCHITVINSKGETISKLV